MKISLSKIPKDPLNKSLVTQVIMQYRNKSAFILCLSFHLHPPLTSFTPTHFHTHTYSYRFEFKDSKDKRHESTRSNRSEVYNKFAIKLYQCCLSFWCCARVKTFQIPYKTFCGNQLLIAWDVVLFAPFVACVVTSNIERTKNRITNQLKTRNFSVVLFSRNFSMVPGLYVRVYMM